MSLSAAQRYDRSLDWATAFLPPLARWGDVRDRLTGSPTLKVSLQGQAGLSLDDVLIPFSLVFRLLLSGRGRTLEMDLSRRNGRSVTVIRGGALSATFKQQGALWDDWLEAVPGRDLCVVERARGSLAVEIDEVAVAEARRSAIEEFRSVSKISDAGFNERPDGATCVGFTASSVWKMRIALLQGKNPGTLHDEWLSISIASGHPAIGLAVEYRAGLHWEAIRLRREAGNSLQDVGKSLSVGERALVLLQVLDAVRYMERRGLTHRDVTPENVFLAGTRVTVIDFDQALLVAPGDSVAHELDHRQPLAPRMTVAGLVSALGWASEMSHLCRRLRDLGADPLLSPSGRGDVCWRSWYESICRPVDLGLEPFSISGAGGCGFAALAMAYGAPHVTLTVQDDLMESARDFLLWLGFEPNRFEVKAT